MAWTKTSSSTGRAARRKASSCLPISLPQRSGQAPFHYDRKTTGRPPVTLDHGEEFKARYREILNVAAYPFGHGLTYGDIVYEELDVGGGRRSISIVGVAAREVEIMSDFTDWEPVDDEFLMNALEQAYDLVAGEFGIPADMNIFVGKPMAR